MQDTTRDSRLRRFRLWFHSLHGALAPAQRIAGGLEHGLISAAAALLAYLPTRFFDLHQGFWAAITAIAVVQTEFKATRSTARDQFIGAAIGSTIGFVIISLFGRDLLTYACAVVLAITIAWLLNVTSAARLSGTTATIILLVPHEGSAAAVTVARIAEVGWGVSVAVMLVWCVNRAGWLKLST